MRLRLPRGPIFSPVVRRATGFRTASIIKKVAAPHTMAKKRAHQLLVSIESCIVLWLVCSGVDGFLTSTAAGRTLLAFAAFGNLAPQQFQDFCKTGRWF